MSDIDEIRQQMALIRRDMHYDVSNVVSDVEDAMDWRSVVRNHPYVLVGVGLAVGYFIVPKRRVRPRQVEQAVANVQPFLKSTQNLRQPEKPPKSLVKRATGWAMGLAWPLVSQSVQAYAGMWLEDQIKQHLKTGSPGEPQGSTSAPSGRPGGPYGGDAVYRMPKRG